jgi:hypothetical protein
MGIKMKILDFFTIVGMTREVNLCYLKMFALDLECDAFNFTGDSCLLVCDATEVGFVNVDQGTLNPVDPIYALCFVNLEENAVEPYVFELSRSKEELILKCAQLISKIGAGRGRVNHINPLKYCLDAYGYDTFWLYRTDDKMNVERGVHDRFPKIFCGETDSRLTYMVEDFLKLNNSRPFRR